ncbi:hypothetical protein LCGC14_0576950 [marine sediment metagenome]|uniref:Uncharacterized protein n=1 Tax=marine sediment metagenome TaxID=412755 RepID=A0A0F9UQT1_9ZZZZ
MDQKIKLKVHEQSLDYKIPVPKRLLDSGFDLTDATIEIRFKNGEYQYIPRSYTFCHDVALCVEELQAIIDELNKLNKE